ncbi:hypothetical protein CERSUDRAFT_95557 [Gelatoporia subvermispora B]|uniref:Uncharacterized protein n=1 Tax=Ceriporiopsis subvermispora (strain B) TaxID=914234 RepID=M2QVT4_CERS8|nr:hypothetical protein CERSUDRAFT_95557 [Gelatoporia subvermispora B]
MSRPVVVFPPPPPTSNNLSSKQRAQLMRSSHKLGQVLGSTPHVLDLSLPPPAPLHVELPFGKPASKPKRSFFKSHSRSRSSPFYDEDDDDGDSVESPVSIRSTSTSSSRSSIDSVKTPAYPTNEQLWRVPHPRQRPPLLKILPPAPVSVEPTLDAIPGSPAYASADWYEDENSLSTLLDPPRTPTFNIASEACSRREKMRRVTRKLGEGVPAHLVFPDSSDSVSMYEAAAAPPPPPPKRSPPPPGKRPAIPFSSCPLPTIMEGLAIEQASPTRAYYRHTASEQPPRRSYFVEGDERRPSRRESLYVDSTGMHGARGETFNGFQCSVSPTRPVPKGRGRRLLEDRTSFIDETGSWRLV